VSEIRQVQTGDWRITRRAADRLVLEYQGQVVTHMTSMQLDSLKEAIKNFQLEDDDNGFI